MEYIWIVIPTAAYDHGILGVYSSEDRAIQRANELWPQTDGHHGFRIERIEIDKDYDPMFLVTLWDHKTGMIDSPRVMVVDHEQEVQRFREDFA